MESPQVKEKESKINAKGELDVEGELKGFSLFQVDGNTHVNGSVEVEKLEVSGSFRCENLKFQHAEINGVAKADNVYGEEIEIDGVLKASKVNAKRIEISGELKASEITADEVILNKKSKVIGTIVASTLKLEKGAEVELAIVKDAEIGVDCAVDNLECYNCKVGYKAEIDYLKYVNSAEIDPEAKVRHSAKVDRISKDFQ